MAYDYPYTGFHFQVVFGLDGAGGEISFQSVKGLEVQLETETLKEGGILSHEHVLPVRSKFSPLILERGVFKPQDSAIIAWCKNALFDFTFNPTTVTISLLNESHTPLITWNLRHVWPKSWKVKDLNAQQGEVLIETLELNYNAFTVSQQG